MSRYKKMVPMYLIFMQYAGIVLELPSNVRFQMDQTNFRDVPLKHSLIGVVQVNIANLSMKAIGATWNLMQVR